MNFNLIQSQFIGGSFRDMGEGVSTLFPSDQKMISTSGSEDLVSGNPLGWRTDNKWRDKQSWRGLK